MGDQRAGGIIQADGEGFGNEDGHHILWQFSEAASGRWWMALLDDRGGWTSFQMELSNPAQRDAFLRGQVPPGVKVASASRRRSKRRPTKD